MSEEYISLANLIYTNIDTILENDNISLFIKNSENIINKYTKIFPNLNYHEIISIYISMTFYFYNSF